MKTALLLIPATNGFVNRQAYMADCIETAMKDGYAPLVYDLVEDYTKLTYSSYVEKILPAVSCVIVFRDFNRGDLLVNMIQKIDYEKPIYEHIIPGAVNKYQNTLAAILNVVSKKTEISIEKLKAKTRNREIVDARFVYYKRAKEHTKESLARIGMFVAKDHATVLHGIKEAENTQQVKDLYNKCFGNG